ncbi:MULTISPECIES: pilus (MSHA type) biogenesis protein MshL [Helicobacter]|uniref:Pilus (MSHA type) biogenesis protein MshL n=1 Tax=Helicobacter ibis TaxID=2962633 RepID=A0ABT4VFK7_9HELI|nr:MULTISPECIES: pilus (MSHA type) biogenesis protein MshL [Helicobacter]MDA3967767.1 pilus (MSHA type) biogenesis protein MshL [Helicobacter sp. WB40]MDA3969486.1 pilus (MSHA type) biogenesis protein MshL [Helicobacter ibis]
MNFKLLFLLFIFYSSLIADCKYRSFSLSVPKDSELSIRDILGELGEECYFSVIYNEDEVSSLLDKELPIINIKDKNLDYVFSVLFRHANLHYFYKNDTLKLKYKHSKTFDLNYINTNRIGNSSTSVSINNEESKGSSGADMISLSRSGVDIQSEDGFNFWANIEDELKEMLTNSEDSDVVVNRGAGLITIRATRTNLDRVESYIKSLHSRLQRQVLIDVNILSVVHKNSYTTGINWDSLYNLQNLTIPFTADSANLENSSGINVSNGEFKYGINIYSQALSLNRVVEFLQTYGNVYSISNPKVLTLNNQPAMISVGDILRYKKSSIYQNTNAQTTLTNTDNEYPSIFAGVLLDITPLIFDDEIMLKINPSITKTKDDNLKQTQALESPPNLTTNQLSSIVRVKNNEQVILGGLISKNTTNVQNKIPLLGHIIPPLFSYTQDVSHIEEIVFIIQPKIIENKELKELSLESLGYKILE